MNKYIIKTNGPILFGTISTTQGTCGKPACKCHTGPKYHHGPYYRWTGVLDGKPTTITLQKEVARECEKRIRNYKAFQKQLKRILNESIKAAPWKSKKSPHN